MRILHFISRLIIGIIFMFSGFVKGIDPLGTAYKLEDYFYAFGLEWMLPTAIFLSILLSTAEFVLGVVVLLNLKPKVNAWLLLIMMLFFTGLTLNDAVYNPVPDCGCFGSAITLTNWQTFYKNAILFVPTLILFFWRKKTIDRFNSLTSYSLAAVFALAFILLSIHSYRHLPMLDFMDWKKGKKMYVENPEPIKYYLTYKNSATGETQEYLSPDYPFNDSVWMAQWEFVSQRTEDPNVSQGHDLQILDDEGNDFTEHFIQNPGYQFFLIAWDLEKSNKASLQKMQEFSQAAEADGRDFIALSSTITERIEEIKQEIGLTFEVYQADDITLKTMVRSNPGLMLLKDGVVLDKWSFNDFPTYSEITKSYPSNPSED